MNNWLRGDGISDAIIGAERAMDAAIDDAAASIRQADELRAEVENGDKPVTGEEVAKFRDYVTGSGRTQEWDEVSRRVQLGETTWRAIVEGQLFGDAQLDSAFASSRRLASCESAHATLGQSGGGVAMKRPPDTSDEEYFDDFSLFN